jgi:hypothetical protein
MRWVWDVIKQSNWMIGGTGRTIAGFVGAGSVLAGTTIAAAQPVLLAQQFACRQVVPAQVPFYSTLPQQQQRPPFDFLPRGSRVSVDLTSPAIRAADGRFYQFVTSPYNSRNTVTGYIPVQFQQNGQFRNSLEPCRRRMW